MNLKHIFILFFKVLTFSCQKVHVNTEKPITKVYTVKSFSKVTSNVTIVLSF
jgi:hypothetical protein